MIVPSINSVDESIKKPYQDTRLEVDIISPGIGYRVIWTNVDTYSEYAYHPIVIVNVTSGPFVFDLVGDHRHDNSGMMKPGDSWSVYNPYIFGFGSITVKATFSATGFNSVSKTKSGYVFGILCILY